MRKNACCGQAGHPTCNDKKTTKRTAETRVVSPSAIKPPGVGRKKIKDVETGLPSLQEFSGWGRTRQKKTKKLFHKSKLGKAGRCPIFGVFAKPGRREAKTC